MSRDNLLGLLKDWGIAAAITLVVLVVLQRASVWLAATPVGLGEAPPLVVADVDGSTFDLHADTRARAYVVNFWATWCGPCRTEIPEFSAFASAHPDVRVLGVSVDQGMSSQQLEAAALGLGITYTVLHDRDQQAARTWGVGTYPTTFVVDRHRRVVAVHVGTMDRRRLEDALALAR